MASALQRGDVLDEPLSAPGARPASVAVVVLHVDVLTNDSRDGAWKGTVFGGPVHLDLHSYARIFRLLRVLRNRRRGHVVDRLQKRHEGTLHTIRDSTGIRGATRRGIAQPQQGRVRLAKIDSMPPCLARDATGADESLPTVPEARPPRREAALLQRVVALPGDGSAPPRCGPRRR